MLDRARDTESVLDCATIADMETENDTETDASAPRVLVTVNQVVAWNIAWFRREAGMTQQELADRLGWPQNKVSEAERSVNGKRTREFDADTLIGLAIAFGVPVNALLLPPLDDLRDSTYKVRPPGLGQDIGMAQLLGAALYGDPDDHSGIMEAYRDRILGAVGKYHGDDWREIVAGWLMTTEGMGILKECLLRMRGDRDRLAAAVDVQDGWINAMEKVIGEGGGE
jgi:transcriptional regulator with XRE-family HTH domain